MKAILALEDGTIFPAISFTGPIETGGEVIFNTGMTGYQEVLTDPSYTGQLVCMTYPLIGNYGVNLEDLESPSVQVAGFIVKECCKQPSNWRASQSLPDYLVAAGIPGIEHVDTRALTRHLRMHGAMRGMISTRVEDTEALVRKAKALPTMEGQNLADRVSTERPYLWTDNGPQYVDPENFQWPEGGPRLVVYDFGIKWNIHRLLADQGFVQLAVPSSYSAAQVRALQPDAVFLSNGPGDPAAVVGAVEATRELCEDLPVAGICLGHQLLGLAMGGKTFKLAFGHHGCNHPVMDLETEKIEISSQNHGFCVDISGLNHLKMTHRNLNDQTLEGFAHRDKPIIAIQFHPEAAPGPHDSCYFFPRFRDIVRSETGK
ncbi:MAG: glutamine-hydrolyzing carbamoyl-phosphate synthase small subunit [Desulfovibrionaceae bacterium]